jgi:hypothetical protein
MWRAMASSLTRFVGSDKRGEGPRCGRITQNPEHFADLFPGVIQALARVDHKVGAGSFFRIGHLAGEDGVKLGFVHVGASQHPLALDIGRG